MATIQVCPECTIEALIDQEGLASVLSLLHDLAVTRLGDDAEWEDDFMLNTPENVNKMLKHLRKAIDIAEGDQND